MAARPPESPIEITSASPTPVVQPNSFPRRTSSPLLEMSQSSASNTRRRVPEDGEDDDDEAPIPVPAPSRRREPFVLMLTGGPRPATPRHGLALPTATQPAAGPSGAAAGVIDLTEDDDDEIEITGQAAPTRPAPTRAAPARRVPTLAEAARYDREDMADYEALVAGNGGAARRRWPGNDQYGRAASADRREEIAPFDVEGWRDMNRQSSFRSLDVMS